MTSTIAPLDPTFPRSTTRRVYRSLQNMKKTSFDQLNYRRRYMREIYYRRVSFARAAIWMFFLWVDITIKELDSRNWNFKTTRLTINRRTSSFVFSIAQRCKKKKKHSCKTRRYILKSPYNSTLMETNISCILLLSTRAKDDRKSSNELAPSYILLFSVIQALNT